MSAIYDTYIWSPVFSVFQYLRSSVQFFLSSQAPYPKKSSHLLQLYYVCSLVKVFVNFKETYGVIKIPLTWVGHQIASDCLSTKGTLYRHPKNGIILYTHTHTHTYIHTYIYTHTHIHTYIHTDIHTDIKLLQGILNTMILLHGSVIKSLAQQSVYKFNFKSINRSRRTACYSWQTKVYWLQYRIAIYWI